MKEEIIWWPLWTEYVSGKHSQIPDEDAKLRILENRALPDQAILRFSPDFRFHLRAYPILCAAPEFSCLSHRGAQSCGHHILVLPDRFSSLPSSD